MGTISSDHGYYRLEVFSFVMGELIYLMFIIGVAALGRLIAWGLDHDRICKCIQNCGGKVLAIARNGTGSRWFGNSARIYDVRYQTPEGKVYEATCETKMFAGVSWIIVVPPGLSADYKKSYASGETINCLKCGAIVPKGQLRCYQCGWSYMPGQQELS